MLIETFPLNMSSHGHFDGIPVYPFSGTPKSILCVGDGALGVLAYRMQMALLGSTFLPPVVLILADLHEIFMRFASAKVNSSEDLSVVGYVLAKPLQEFLEEQLSSSRSFIQVRWLRLAWPS